MEFGLKLTCVSSENKNMLSNANGCPICLKICKWGFSSNRIQLGNQIFILYMFSFCRPRGPLLWLDPGAFGTLGVGGGFALGAKLCRPNSDVYIIYGDGSLGYSVAEFDTFTRFKVSHLMEKLHCPHI